MESTLRDRFGVEVDVSITDPTVTPSSTASARVTLENRSAEPRTLSYVDRSGCAENRIRGEYRGRRRDRLALVPSDPYRGGECWFQRVECLKPTAKLTERIPSGGRVQWEYDLRQTEMAGECMPPGRYDFEREFGAATGGDDTEAQGSIRGETATLQFTLLSS